MLQQGRQQHRHRRRQLDLAIIVSTILVLFTTATAFQIVPKSFGPPIRVIHAEYYCNAATRKKKTVEWSLALEMTSGGNADDNTLARVSDDEEGTPIPFLDADGKSFIECFADSTAILDGVTYTIGVPCDHSVALCYIENDGLIPVELDDRLMDDVFPIAEATIADEFGEVSCNATKWSRLTYRTPFQHDLCLVNEMS